MKLVNFKIGKIDSDEKINIAALNHMSPEMILGKYSYETDIWSLGVILHYCTTSKFPFEFTTKEELFNIINPENNLIFDLPHLNNNNNTSSDYLKDFIRKMLTPDIAQRLNLGEAFQHEFLKKYEDSDVEYSSNLIPDNTETYFFSNNNYVDKLEKDWMKRINGERLLSEISIPGTHDSGSDKLDLEEYDKAIHVVPTPKINGMYQAQSLSISTQLSVGIRYLDIRLKSDGWIYHREYKTKNNFKQVVEDVKLFLKENPSETVIMRVKDESDDIIGADISKYLHRVINENNNLFAKLNKTPSLNEVRGKVVLFVQIKNFTKEYLTWEDRNIMTLQDSFVVNLRSMKKWQIKTYQNQSIKKDKDIMSFNHVSGTQAQYFIDIQNVAYTINPVVFELKGSCLGVVITDFPSEQLVKFIISRNFDDEPDNNPLLKVK